MNPCPRCGSDRTEVYRTARTIGPRTEYVTWYVECLACGARTADRPEEAAVHWWDLGATEAEQ